MNKPTNQEIDEAWRAIKMLNLPENAGQRMLVNHFFQPKKVTYCWECNECGSQEYGMSVSENDVHALGCGNCGQSEWHKAVYKE